MRIKILYDKILLQFVVFIELSLTGFFLDEVDCPTPNTRQYQGTC